MTISRKIAIIGTARAGKTVFLTSLINHLEEHHKTDFVVGKEEAISISDFKRQKVSKSIGAKFNYGACRDALVNSGEWPKKTRDTSHFICDFKRSDWKYHRNELHFFDFPGERLSDVAIAQYPDYADWADHMLEYISSDTIYRQLAEDYLELQIKGAYAELHDIEVLALYRQVLAKFAVNYKPMITPSTFMLDQEGNTPISTSVEDFYKEASERLLGLVSRKGVTHQFAPIAEQSRKRNPSLAKLYSKAYKEYRSSIVMPVFKDLKSSNRLIILIDIPSLLNGGVAMYNDNREILEKLFEVLQPELWYWRIFTSAVKIDRIAFVATKSDAIYPAEVKDGRLMGLLQQMTERFAYSLDEVEVEWFTCSAVVSAKMAEGEYKMRGPLISSCTPDVEQVFEVSSLPEQWPRNWMPSDFQFPSVLPKVPANKGIAPEQFGLDDVFTFITTD